MDDKKKNYIPGSMSFGAGFLPISRLTQDFIMVYGEKKAKEIIHELLKKKRNIDFAEVGLDGDWKQNHDTLYSDGKFHDPDFYERSAWATPILLVFFKDAPSESYEVFTKEPLFEKKDKKDG